MKIRKYGYSEFKNSTPMRFAVMVPIVDYDKTQTDEHGFYKVNKVTWKFVTDIWVNGHREWRAENNKKAYLWGNRKSAQDFCIGLAWNNASGYVVEVLEGMEPSNNW